MSDFLWEAIISCFQTSIQNWSIAQQLIADSLSITIDINPQTMNREHLSISHVFVILRRRKMKKITDLLKSNSKTKLGIFYFARTFFNEWW